MNLYDRIESDFTYHPPKDDLQIETFRVIRDMAKGFAQTINALVPDGREKSSALTKVEEAVFWANAGIARSGA